MAGPAPRNDYGTFGSVASEKPTETGGGVPFSVRANGSDFGAQAGEAKTQFGGQVQKLGDEANELAIKYQGIVNETAATNAETDLISKMAGERAKYTAMTGNAAVNYQQTYLKNINDMFEQSRSNLSGGAQRMFDASARRLLANYTSEGITYGVAQGKDMLRDAGTQQNKLYQEVIAPQSAMGGPQSLDDILGNVHYNVISQIPEDAPGIKKDPISGEFSFTSDEAGKSAQKIVQADLDNAYGKTIGNYIETQSKVDPIKASQTYEKYKNMLSAPFQASISAMLAPKVIEAHAATAVHATMMDTHMDYAKAMTTPSNGPNPYNLGNVKTAEGAAGGTQDFLNPATPTDGVVATANQLRSGYQNMTLSQIAQKWTGEPDKAAAWTANAVAASGLNPNAKLDLNDPTILKSVLKGMAAAEKSPQDRAAFTDDVIDKGVQTSLSGGQANLIQGTPKVAGMPEQNYGRNDSGTLLTPADYMRMNRDAIMQRAQDYAERTMPGDLRFRQMVMEGTKGIMAQTISQQEFYYRDSMNQVMKGILGELPGQKGPPQTEDELRAVPGLSDIISSLPTRDKASQDFYNNIPTMISRFQRRITDTNSANSYDAALRALMPYDTDHPDGIFSQRQLNELLGSKNPDAINGKDYEDIKPLLSMSHATADPWKVMVSQHMQAIAAAGGDVDGRGKQRAMNYFNAMVKAKMAQPNEQQSSVITPEEKKLLEDTANSMMVSREQQIKNVAQVQRGQPATPVKGDVIDGYTFNGGDPSKKENWSKI